MGQRNDGEVGARLRQIGQGAGGVDVKKGEGAGKALRPQKVKQVWAWGVWVVGSSHWPAKTAMDSGEKSGLR
jgi:hypothetical protein